MILERQSEAREDDLLVRTEELRTMCTFIAGGKGPQNLAAARRVSLLPPESPNAPEKAIIPLSSVMHLAGGPQ